MRIELGDLDHPDVIELLKFHLETNMAVTPPQSVHALDLGALKAPSIRFFAGWDGDSLLSIGAWKRHDAELGEIKSMRTAEMHRAKGLGAQMLHHIIEDAKAHTVSRLSLETGSFDYFEPARRLYEKSGFSYCKPFADYGLDPNSTYMTKLL